MAGYSGPGNRSFIAGLREYANILNLPGVAAEIYRASKEEDFTVRESVVWASILTSAYAVITGLTLTFDASIIVKEELGHLYMHSRGIQHKQGYGYTFILPSRSFDRSSPVNGKTSPSLEAIASQPTTGREKV